MARTKRSWRVLAGAVLLTSALPVAGFGADLKPTIEANTSRWGSDYKRFVIGAAEACAAACAADDQCRSWSYIKPTDNASALCRLKSTVPEAKADPCCASGIAPTAVGSITEANRKIAVASPKSEPSGITGSIKKKDKKTKAAGVAAAAKAPGEVLQMPIEAETPEALTTISAPLDMPEPSLGD